MSSQFTAIYEKGEQYYIGYCLEISGANGQGETLDECRESLREAIKLILEDRVEDGLRGVPAEAICEPLVVYETA
jgi:predicted RNase H-like HicB family nuclease